MTNSRTFGRRAGIGTGFPHPTATGHAKVPPPKPVEATSGVQPAILSVPPVDEELDAWRRERRRTYRLPWRQMLLVGSLSFLIASFVLPASVNGTVDRVLDLLSAAGFVAWLRGGKQSHRPSIEP